MPRHRVGREVHDTTGGVLDIVQRPREVQGFAVRPHCGRVGERTYGGLRHCRHLRQDYAEPPVTLEAWIRLVLIHLMLRHWI